MAQNITCISSGLDSIRDSIKELERIGMEVIDYQASELIRISKDRSLKLVDGKQHHYNSLLRFSYKQSGGHVYFYLSRLLKSLPTAAVEHPFTEIIQKRKTYPYYTDKQIYSLAKEWETECLIDTRNILADITLAISHLKESARSYRSATRLVSIRGEKAQLESEYSPIARIYLEHVN